MEKRHDLGDDTYEYEVGIYLLIDWNDFLTSPFSCSQDVSDGSSAIITMEPSEGAMAVQINLGEPNKVIRSSLTAGTHRKMSLCVNFSSSTLRPAPWAAAVTC